MAISLSSTVRSTTCLGPILVISTGLIRGHSFKLIKENFKTIQRQNYLTNRMFSVWTGLPSNVVNSTSVNSVKNNFDLWYRGVQWQNSR